MRKPYKVTPRVLARIQALRASGKSIAVVAGLCELSPECVRKWLIKGGRNVRRPYKVTPPVDTFGESLVSVMRALKKASAVMKKI